MQITRSGPASVADRAVEQLRAALKGRVITPRDAEYDAARTVFPGGVDRRPAAIARVADADDAARVISVARETGLPLAVRSGGHSGAGHGVCDRGIVLDLRDMRRIEIDAERRTARADAGITARAYTVAAGELSLATGFGDTGSVGVAGLTLGGGIGFLVRKHGLTIDSLLSADVVTADGQLLHADRDSHADLFWAIRGGGGNFGVATRFEFRLHELPTVLGGMLFLPATPATVADFLEAAAAAPEELSTIANVMPAPPMPFLPAEQHGRLVIFAMMVYAGDPEAGRRAVAPFRAIAAPIADMLRPMAYADMYPADEGDYHPTAVARTMFLDSVDRAVAGEIIGRLEASDAPMRVAQLRVLGGAMARVPADATAFAHRRSRIMANLASFYDGPEDRAVREAWVSSFAQDLRQSDAGAYVNFVGDEGEAGVRAAYPAQTWDRLAAIKRRYDPANLFRLNQNIPPAA
jgi:FAD/FMN-containing dehydrogenase